MSKDCPSNEPTAEVNETPSAQDEGEGLRPRLVTAFFALLVAVVILQVTRLGLDKEVQHHELNSQEEKLDQDRQTLFASFDDNKDGVIDFEEFLPIARKLLAKSQRGPTDTSWTSGSEIREYSVQEHILIAAEFTPLLLESMFKFKSSFFQFSDRNIQGLTSWKSAVVPRATFPVEQFANAFLSDDASEIGKPWYIVHPNMDGGEPLSSSRYHPPPLSSPKHQVLHDLLKMLHPNPFLHMRFAPQGTVACTRAQNQDYYDIMFRVHAEFQLSEPPDQPPFWFTPAQFSGQITITKNGSHIRNFTMFVPANQSLNVDMEWQTDTKLDDTYSGTEVDIGYLPKMGLHSVAPSSMGGYPAKCDNKVTDTTEKDINTCSGSSSSYQQVEPLQWDTELSREFVQRKIDETFYPFLKVPFMDFDKAVERAEHHHKLLHVILLWGALTDQSC